MRRHVKASSAGSIEGNGKRRGLLDRTLVTQRALAVLVLAICALAAGAASASAAAPTVLKTNDATEVGYTTAKVSGEVERPADPDPAFDTECNFEYIPVADFAPQSEVKRLTVTGVDGIFAFYLPSGQGTPTLPFDASPAAVQSALEGLADIGPGNVTVTGGPGDPYGSSPYLITFGGALENKDVELGVYGEGAGAHGLIADLVTVTEGHVDGWGIAKRAPCEPESPLTTPGKTAVSANLTGLTTSPVGTEYRLRLTASNSDGSDSKEANTFTTKAVSIPTVSIDPVTTLTDTTAHFVGHVTPGGTDPAFDTNWRFQCTPVCPNLTGGTIPADESSHEVEVDATGLEPNTSYEVKLVASNAGGPNSAQASFQTSAVAPDALTVPAFVLEGGTSVLVGARVNPHNSASTWWVEYGTTSGYGQSLPASQDAGAGSGGQLKFLTHELTGLALDTTYHFRVSAKNAQGDVHGEDLTFTTPSPAGPPSSCSNAAFRTGPSAALPDCRAYESVTTLDLLGTPATPLAVAEDGERALWQTYANLPEFDAGGVQDTYLAKRAATGWSSTLASPPGKMLRPYYQAGLLFRTPNLDGRTIWDTYNVFNPEDPDPTTTGSNFNDFYRRELDGSFVWINRGSAIEPRGSDGLTFEGATADGLTVFFTDRDARKYEPDGPGIYRRSGQTTTVLKDENGDAIQGHIFGMTADASVVAIYDFNTMYVYKQAVGHAVRISNASIGSFEASGIGLSADGSKLFLAAHASLTSDDNDSSGSSAPIDIFEYDVDAGDFKRLSGTAAGPGPGNGKADANPLLMSPDGSAVYFTSTEQLDGSKGVSGATNLYRAEGGAIHYAMTLTGALQNPRFTGDGKKLVFQSSDRLTAYDNKGNAKEGHRELYVYDSTDGGTVCISCRPSGEVATGDAGFGSADRDGDRFFFTSNDVLLPQDENGKNDVYELNVIDGAMSLISTGKSPAPSSFVGNSADGRDVFFTSVDSLRPHDQNGGTQKLFDARIGGGFPEPPPPPMCEGEGCRGAGSSKPADVAPATPSFSGPGNPKPKHKKAKKHKHKSHKKHQSKSHKRDADRNGRTGR